MISNANILNQIPGYIGWKDVNFVYQGCNANLANIMGLSDAREIIGLTDSHLHDEDEKLQQFHRANDGFSA